MEAMLVDRLRLVSRLRRKVMTLIVAKVPALNALEINWVFHAVCIASTVFLILTLYATERTLSLLSFHPLCMIVATGLCIPEGIVAYKNRYLLETLAPIMQHNKRSKVRAIHQSIQGIGAAFLFMGLLFILSEKIEIHQTVLPMSFHSIMGALLLLFIVVQVIVGQLKLQHHELQHTQRRIHRWHGDMGLLLWDWLCFTLFTGLVRYLPLQWTSFLAYLLPFCIWFAVLSQFFGRHAVKDDELDSSQFAAGEISVTEDGEDAVQDTDSLLPTVQRRSHTNLTALDGGNATLTGDDTFAEEENDDTF